jgi:hypothetical protein
MTARTGQIVLAATDGSAAFALRPPPLGYCFSADRGIIEASRLQLDEQEAQRIMQHAIARTPFNVVAMDGTQLRNVLITQCAIKATRIVDRRTDWTAQNGYKERTNNRGDGLVTLSLTLQAVRMNTCTICSAPITRCVCLAA